VIHEKQKINVLLTHRQSGNLLLLLATYHDEHLRSLIPHALLVDLVDKTLEFVNSVKFGSRALGSMYDLVRWTAGRVLGNV